MVILPQNNPGGAPGANTRLTLVATRTRGLR